MTANPFTHELDTLERKYSNLEVELLDGKKKLAWFQNFNLDREISA
jgi:hypothetical protein